MNATTSPRHKKDQTGLNYVDKFYIAGGKCRWYGMVKVRYHAEVSVVEPPSLESDCEVQEWKENAPARREGLITVVGPKFITGQRSLLPARASE